MVYTCLYSLVGYWMMADKLRENTEFKYSFTRPQTTYKILPLDSFFFFFGSGFFGFWEGRKGLGLLIPGAQTHSSNPSALMQRQFKIAHLVQASKCPLDFFFFFF